MSLGAVLLTGGSHGLGATLVETLARRGAPVTFTYASSRDRAERLAERLREEGHEVRALQADARDFGRAHAVVEEVRKDLGVDVLINNVGGAGADEGPIWRMSEAGWDAVIGLNLKSCFNYTHAVAASFMARRHGTIVNVGSINGLRGREGQPAYTAAKAGMLGFTKTVAKELGPYGVNVNMVATGYIDTEKQRGKVSDAHRQRILDASALKHLIQPEEVAGVVAFLCSEDARHMTGAVLRLDAGEYI